MIAFAGGFRLVDDILEAIDGDREQFAHEIVGDVALVLEFIQLLMAAVAGAVDLDQDLAPSAKNSQEQVVQAHALHAAAAQHKGDHA